MSVRFSSRANRSHGSDTFCSLFEIFLVVRQMTSLCQVNYCIRDRWQCTALRKYLVLASYSDRSMHPSHAYGSVAGFCCWPHGLKPTATHHYVSSFSAAPTIEYLRLWRATAIKLTMHMCEYAFFGGANPTVEIVLQVWKGYTWLIQLLPYSYGNGIAKSVGKLSWLFF